MATGKRMKAADRRILILEAAQEEYGRGGMHATSVEVIADRAGVSQPYIFRLFGTKNDLMAAVIEYHTAKLRQAFRNAVEQRDAETSPLEAMALAYIGFMNEDVNSLRCQLHTWAAASDPAIKDVAQRTYREIWEDIAELSGATADEIRDFMGHGMLLTVLASLDLTDLFGDPLAVAKEY
ncbi:TetR/AcrR family transcriptional regulator [Aeromicrobium sp.]|uniref:TetR/AcrR family transcriptional regulator n=1 Tax=Aeromicrobium sp. TaxID=1871063 RepID=UPI002FC92E67